MNWLRRCYALSTGERAVLWRSLFLLPLAAHAWIELDGDPLGEDARMLERYTALPALPAR